MNVRSMTPWLVFLDVIMNGFVGVTALFGLAVTQMNPEATDKPAMETLGKYVVVMTWEDDSNADVDLYVRDPNGNIAFYSARDTGLMNLEYDDLGLRSDRMYSGNGSAVVVESNQERVILRGVIPGEYVVNVRIYEMNDAHGAEVTVRLHRLRGIDAELHRRTLRLTHNKEERTAFRFTVDADENVTGFNELPLRLSAATGK